MVALLPTLFSLRQARFTLGKTDVVSIGSFPDFSTRWKRHTMGDVKGRDDEFVVKGKVKWTEAERLRLDGNISYHSKIPAARET
jgi:hypothetical protein